MRIHKIQLDNFASYNKATLDIDKLGNVINVFGSTGAGKTTLLVDSISFCLFGKAYGEKSPGSERLVIRPHQNRSRAELEFSIGEKRYKLIREIELVSSSKISSKVILMEKIGNDWKNKAIGSNTIKEFIEKNLKIDYDTFLKTIAIRQGDVTAILESEPSERRELFLKMLNVDFKKEREIVKEKRDKIRYELDRINGFIIDYEQKINQETKIDEEIKNAIEQLVVLRKLLDKLKFEKNDLEKEKEKKEKELNELKKKKEIYEQRLKDYEDKIKKIYEIKENIEKSYEKIKNEEVFKKSLEEVLRKIERLDQFKDLFNKINNKEIQLSYLMQRYEKILKDIEIIEEAKKKIEEIEMYKKELQIKSDTYEKLSILFSELQDEITALQTNLDQIKRLKEAIEVSNVEERKCPICGSFISEEKFDEIYHHFMEEEARIERDLKDKREKINVLEKEKKRLENEISNLQKLTGAEEAYKKIISNKIGIFEEKKELDKNIESLKKELNELKSHELYLEFKNIKDIDNYRKELLDNKNDLEKKLKEIEKEKIRMEEFKNNIMSIEKEIKELEVLLSDKPNEKYIMDLSQEIEELKNKIAFLIEKINKINQEIGRIEERERSLKEKKEEIEKAKKDLEELKKRKIEYEEKLEIYEILYNDVFNEKGFPLRFLDSYIEDLNQIINTEYLTPILNNKRVEIKRIEDNIEIRVFDDIYPRELVTYSGGEKTAIGFAIRLAIAKTLALRRGISPKFLIIDEGFGPLSVEIRDLLLRSILNLKHEYEKIFIVSHLEDIQENPMFDSVIKIFKDENNISHIEILK